MCIRDRRISVKNGLGEYLSKMGMTQLRIAETEKYAHVTFFFNGGVEKQYPGAVSYTHLDVYKRQPHSPPAWGSLRPP